MKVKEMIEYLKEMPEDLDLATDGYEGGITEDISKPSVKKVKVDVNKGVWYYGDHELYSEKYDKSYGGELKEVVYI